MALHSFTFEDISHRVPRAGNELASFDVVGELTPNEDGFEGIVGRSSALRRVLRMVEHVAAGDSTVLLLGETGTGKELIARAIHNCSSRRDQSFVKVNCAAIPSGLLESELFGHERGAFTGAITQKIGRLELADQGSLFLDEIGDIPLELQPKLLRVLQEREFERLGSTRTRRVDVRVVAATHRDLEGMILEKQFRSDLYYRLNVVPIFLPPLRERPEDIPLLVQHFVQQFARRTGKTVDTIPPDTTDALTRHPWPGNIRELENVIERAIVLSPGPVLRVSHQDLRTRVAPGHDPDQAQTLEEVERNHILKTLRETRWALSGPSGAAARLGLNRSTLYFRMKKLGITRSLNASFDP
jgi:formate hydrogenlyase transcriptional activator